MRDHDVIVVGLGVMGLATCAELARRGVRVLGLEQFGIPHGRGSSHGTTRIFRTAYFEHADYVPLLKRSHALWRDLERRSGAKLLHEIGALYMGPAGSELVHGSLASAEAHGLAVERLDHAQLAARFPQFVLPEDTIAVLEPTAGMLMAERAIVTMARLAVAEGAELKTFEPVRSWRSRPDGFEVTTESATHQAPKLIFCGGAWSGRLLADLGLPLRSTRQISAWLLPRRPGELEPGRLPVWAVELADGSFHYGFPLQEDAPGVKIARHEPGETFDPDSPDRSAGPEEARSLVEFAARHLPDAAGLLANVQVCMYTMTPDGHFIVDRHPRHEGLYVACGFSGHGFKFAPVIGEVLADLATEGATRHPIAFLSAERLRAG